MISSHLPLGKRNTRPRPAAFPPPFDRGPVLELPIPVFILNPLDALGRCGEARAQQQGKCEQQDDETHV